MLYGSCKSIGPKILVWYLRTGHFNLLNNMAFIISRGQAVQNCKNSQFVGLWDLLGYFYVLLDLIRYWTFRLNIV